MPSFIDGIIISSMGKKIGVDTTLTFVCEGHLQGHKVKIVFSIILLTITGQNHQSRPTLLYYIRAECGRTKCPLLCLCQVLSVKY